MKNQPAYSTRTICTDLSDQDGTHYVRFGTTILPIDLFTKVMDPEGEIHHWEYTDFVANIRYIIWND